MNIMKVSSSLLYRCVDVFVRFDFMFLSLFVIIINLPYFAWYYVPYHDSMYFFDLFYFFYNHFFFHNNLAQWMPYDSYGLPINHEQIFGLSAISYFFMFIGWIFKVKNVLLLFKATVLFEQLVLLTGMYLLSRILFNNRRTVYIVCIGAVCSCYWLHQLMFDLHTFYMFPLSLYLLILFFRSRAPEFLWLTGIILFSWIMGNSLYCMSLWIATLFIVFVVLLLKDVSVLKCIFQKKPLNIVLFIFFIVLCFAYYMQLNDIRGYVNFLSRGHGGANTLATFLIWGEVRGFPEFLKNQFLGLHDTRYMGLLPILFFIISIIWIRKKEFFAFLAPVIFLIWLYCGGLFSVLCYYIPGMKYYRHITYTYGMIKILMLICAGYGLDLFWKAETREKIKYLFISLAVMVFIYDSHRLTGRFLHELSFSSTPKKDFFLVVRPLSVFPIAGIYLVVFISIVIGYSFFVLLHKFRYKDKKKWIVFRYFVDGMLIFVFFIDILYFQILVFKLKPRLSKDYKDSVYVYYVHKFEFMPFRKQEPKGQRQKDAYRLISRKTAGTNYPAVYNFIQFDTCYTEFYTHMHSKGFTRLMNTRHTIDRDLLKVIGCGFPKFRLIGNAKYFDTIDEASDTMKKMPKLFDTLIIRSPSRVNKAIMHSYLNSGALGHIKLVNFNPNEVYLNVNVSAKQGAWLVYADNYHKGWHAEVNGKEVPVEEAYLAFKAVYLNKGHNKVHLFYWNGIISFISYFIALFGFISAILLVYLFMFTSMTNSPLGLFREK